jgi:hypothetical protein
MPVVGAEQIRDLLMPGLYSVVGQYSQWPVAQWEEVFAGTEPAVLDAVPLLSPQVASQLVPRPSSLKTRK